MSTLLSLPATAKVVVLTNRTTRPAVAVLLPSGQPTTSVTVAPGESKPVFFNGTLRIRYRESRIQREYELDPSSAYFFTYGTQVNGIRLEKIGLGADPILATPKEKLSKAAAEPPEIRVKLLVDDDEPTHQHIWEARIRDRFQAAATIIERHSGVRLVIDSVSTWDSDDRVNNFNHSLREFENEIVLQPAQLAIGFSSQYHIERGRVHLGGTRGALHPYILLKERSPQVRETERLELLVHELGHYFGAAHSPEPTSVMRPLISGGKQRALRARIQFDPVNTLLMAMVGDEFRKRRIHSISALPISKKKQMAEIYKVLDKAMPKDPAAKQCLRLLGRMTSSPLVEETRRVLKQLVIIARLHQQISRTQLSTKESKTAKPLILKNNDATTDWYVRQAALTSLKIKSGNANRAFLLALGIFMDDTTTLRTFPQTSQFVKLVESDAERLDHLRVLGQPTMHSQHDIAKHFFVSAFTVVTMGGKPARLLGLTKELADAHQGSGFSFADMAANRAGIIFAERLLAGQLTLSVVSQKFSCEAFLPPIDHLPENLTAKELKEQFGGIGGKKLSAELSRIENLILDLPIYEQLKPADQ